MSHIVTIETEVRDASAVQAACERLKLPAAAHGLHELFSGTAQGLAALRGNSVRTACLRVRDGVSGPLEEINFDPLSVWWLRSSRLGGDGPDRQASSTLQERHLILVSLSIVCRELTPNVCRQRRAR
jgi:hypothetical protein